MRAFSASVLASILGVSVFATAPACAASGFLDIPTIPGSACAAGLSNLVAIDSFVSSIAGSRFESIVTKPMDASSPTFAASPATLVPEPPSASPMRTGLFGFALLSRGASGTSRSRSCGGRVRRDAP